MNKEKLHPQNWTKNHISAETCHDIALTELAIKIHLAIAAGDTSEAKGLLLSAIGEDRRPQQ
jgi:hypothetical protein